MLLGSGLPGDPYSRLFVSYSLPRHRLFTASKKLLKRKGLPVKDIRFRYKMSGNVMICQVFGGFSLVLGLSDFSHSYSVFFNDLR